MILRIVENALISIFNRVARGGRSRPVVLQPATPPEDAVVLGQPLDPQGDTPILTPDERRRHMYILGATGTGKTNFLMRLIEADIRSGRTFCVIDLRGDLVDRIIPRLAQNERIISSPNRLLLVDL